METLDGQLAAFAKEEALDLLEDANQGWLQVMRDAARLIYFFNGEVTSDDLRKFADTYDFHPPTSNKAFGAIFRGPAWEAVGFTTSKLPTSHARPIRVWRYIGQKSAQDNQGPIQQALEI